MQEQGRGGPDYIHAASNTDPRPDCKRQDSVGDIAGAKTGWRNRKCRLDAGLFRLARTYGPSIR